MKRKSAKRMLERYRITEGKDFRLKDCDPDDIAEGLVAKNESQALLADGVSRLSALQELLYPHASWALLCIFQAMDAAGKDGTIKHVMSGVNPQGVQVSSFKVPPRTVASAMKSHVHTWFRCVAVVGNPVETPRRISFRFVGGTRSPSSRRSR